MHEFKDVKEMIGNKFIDNGWVCLYKNYSKNDGTQSGSVYSTIINKNIVKEKLKYNNWDLFLEGGRLGFVFSNNGAGEEIAEYKKEDENIERMIFYRNFHGARVAYLELSEEFRLYFNLFEEVEKGIRKYIYFYENGDEENIAEVGQEYAKVRLKFLKEFISAKQMDLVIYFCLRRFDLKSVSELKIEEKNEITKEEEFIYNHFIGNIEGRLIKNYKTQSEIIGKVVINQIKDYEPRMFENSIEETEKYEEFAISYDENGDLIYFSCNEDLLSNFYDKNEGAPNFLTSIYFDRQVLKKYYDNPQKYVVHDGYVECKGFWTLTIDNSCKEYVMVFLGDMGKISYREQKYWKSFNLPPKDGMSRTCFERSFLAKFSAPESPDLFFKMKYSNFRKKWFEKFAWDLYKELNNDDKHYYTSLHSLTSENNQKEFDEQILALTKIMIDSINEKEITKKIDNIEDKDRGIDKFTKFLQINGYSNEEMTEFIKNVQRLRSNSVAHRRSEGNADLKKALKYFEIEEKGLKLVLDDIFLGFIKVINTLENIYLE